MMAAKAKAERILRQVAESEKISDFEVIPDDDVVRGDGFLSEFYTGAVRNNETGELIKTYIKLPPLIDNDQKLVDNAYFNEYNFYSSVFPKLDEFQRSKGVKAPFDKIPKFYCGSLTPDDVHLVLENLKVQNYVLYDKTKFMDQKHLKRIFETYGKYHALTFAFKDQNRDAHDELVEPIKDTFEVFLDSEDIHSMLRPGLQVAYDIIRQGDEAKGAKVKTLLDDIRGTAMKEVTYQGQHSALVHGDCWSNNIMFHYDAKGDVENLKLLDHQLLRESTPIHDLSYFFYTAASKEDLDKLYDYLDLYHESFSDSARELGSDPDKLLPLEVLKAEWKKYGFLGIVLGVFIWPIKLMPKDQVQGLSELSKKEQETLWRENLLQIWNSEFFKKAICDLLLHAIDYGII